MEAHIAAYGAEILRILGEEGVSIEWVDQVPEPVSGRLSYGGYQPDLNPKKVLVDRCVAGVDDAWPIIAHELGHYLDWRSDPDPGLPRERREQAANRFMVDLADRYGARPWLKDVLGRWGLLVELAAQGFSL